MGNNVSLIPKQPARHSLLTNVENVVYMPLASKHSHGIVKIGNGLNIASDGLLSVDFTADWYSGVKTDVEQLKVDVDSVKIDIDELVVSLDDFEEVLRNHDTRIDNNANAIASKIDSTYLQNYYTKAETYNKQEINRLIVPTQGLKKEIVSELPTENISESTLYLVPKIDISGNDYYNEYLYINGQWELVGTTQTSLDGYVTLEDFNKLVNNEIQIVSSDGGGFLAGNANSANHETGGIAIGGNANSSGVYSISIGSNSHASQASTVALGNGARAFALKAIQLGPGTNSTANSLQVHDDNIYNAETHTLTVQNIELNGENLAEKLENAGGTNIVKVEEDTLTTNKLEKVVHLSDAQYQELITNGSITIGEQTLTYDENAIYVTPDNSESGGGSAEGGASAKKYQHNLSLFAKGGSPTFYINISIVTNSKTEIQTLDEIVVWLQEHNVTSSKWYPANGYYLPSGSRVFACYTNTSNQLMVKTLSNNFTKEIVNINDAEIEFITKHEIKDGYSSTVSLVTAIYDTVVEV